ncbi:hypothetical protein ACRJ4W_31910 [Streptomyces sp. GLT-R25]
MNQYPFGEAQCPGLSETDLGRLALGFEAEEAGAQALSQALSLLGGDQPYDDPVVQARMPVGLRSNMGTARSPPPVVPGGSTAPARSSSSASASAIAVVSPRVVESSATVSLMIPCLS